MQYDAVLNLILRHVEAENRHDLPATLDTLHPDCEFIDHAMQRRFRGHAGASEHYELWWRAFDLQVRGERRLLSTDGVFVAETRFKGRHHGEFMGIPASGRSIDLHVAVFVDFRDGLMATEGFYYDMGDLLRQIKSGPR